MIKQSKDFFFSFCSENLQIERKTFLSTNKSFCGFFKIFDSKKGNFKNNNKKKKKKKKKNNNKSKNDYKPMF